MVQCLSRIRVRVCCAATLGASCEIFSFVTAFLGIPDIHILCATGSHIDSSRYIQILDFSLEFFQQVHARASFWSYASSLVNCVIHSRDVSG